MFYSTGAQHAGDFLLPRCMPHHIFLPSSYLALYTSIWHCWLLFLKIVFYCVERIQTHVSFSLSNYSSHFLLRFILYYQLGCPLTLFSSLHSYPLLYKLILHYQLNYLLVTLFSLSLDKLFYDYP